MYTHFKKIERADSSKGITVAVVLQPEGEVVELIVQDKTIYLEVLAFYSQQLAEADVAVHGD